MNKSALYVVLLFLIILLLSLWQSYLQQQPISLSKNGLQFTSIDKTHVILSANKDEVFIIHKLPEQITQTYKIDSYHSGTKGVRILLAESPYKAQSEEELVISAINGQMQFRDTLMQQRYAERLALLESTQQFSGWRLLQQEEDADFFSFIDRSPLIILVIALLLFFLLWIYDGMSGILIPLLKNQARLFSALFFLALVTFLLIKVTSPAALAESKVSVLIRIVSSLLFTYLLFQYVLKHHLSGKDFPDREFLKFACLFVGGLTITMLSTEMAAWIDQRFFAASTYTMLNKHSFLALEALYAFSFALANLLNNLRKHIRRLRGSEQQLQQSQQQALASEAELNALQASVNPHFLYNSLNSIASLAQTSPDKTERMALALSSFYEYATNREEEHLCKLEEELEMIRNYLAIEKIRFGKRLQYDIQCSQAALAFRLPRFLLQPIVENAIKYGYNSASDKILVHLEAQFEKGQLLLHVFDEGEAFGEQMAMGYGLRSVSKKLRLLFPGKHRLEFINEPRKQVYIQLTS